MADIKFDFKGGPRFLTEEEQAMLIERAAKKLVKAMAEELPTMVFNEGDRLEFGYVVEFGDQPAKHRSGTVKVISDKGE